MLTSPMPQTLGITKLSLTDETLEPGGTTTVTTTFDYSGDEADLLFRWNASSGQIIGDASVVTYVAPNMAGTHTITLELTDGFEIVEHFIAVEVVASQSLPIDSNIYWAGQGEVLVLKYQVSVTQILRQTVTLRYDIRQDEAKTGAFLSVEVNGTLLVEEEAIGEVNPAERTVISGTVDVSGIVTEPGTYEITLTLVVVNAVEHGWFLQRAELIGAEGSAVQL